MCVYFCEGCCVLSSYPSRHSLLCRSLFGPSVLPSPSSTLFPALTGARSPLSCWPPPPPTTPLLGLTLLGPPGSRPSLFGSCFHPVPPPPPFTPGGLWTAGNDQLMGSSSRIAAVVFDDRDMSKTGTDCVAAATCHICH